MNIFKGQRLLESGFMNHENSAEEFSCILVCKR